MVFTFHLATTHMVLKIVPLVAFFFFYSVLSAVILGVSTDRDHLVLASMHGVSGGYHLP